MSLAQQALDGNRRSMARLITQVENRTVDPAEAALIYKHSGKAQLIGVTGAPGTGKSSLVNKFALKLREKERTVAILAVDPTSPFSGGAILGDRIRMRELSGDPGVFIRSMASRGSLGGLARTTSDVINVLDASGYDVVLVETVGAGQSEVEIVRYAHTVLVVEAPGLGDDVQAFKAGILEIADILVVNKADDPRAKNTASALRQMLEISGRAGSLKMDVEHHGHLMEAAMPDESDEKEEQRQWRVPIQMTNSLKGEGVSELLALADAHHDFLVETDELSQRQRIRAAAELDLLLRDTLLLRLLGEVDPGQLAALVDETAARRQTAQVGVDELVGNLFEEVGEKA